jgi:hypothetical protein
VHREGQASVSFCILDKWIYTFISDFLDYNFLLLLWRGIVAIIAVDYMV